MPMCANHCVCAVVQLLLSSTEGRLPTPFSIYLSLWRSSCNTLLAPRFCLLKPGSDNWLLTVGVKPKKWDKKGKSKKLESRKNQLHSQQGFPRAWWKNRTVSFALCAPRGFLWSSWYCTFPFLPSESPALSLSCHMDTPQSLSHWPTLLSVRSLCLISGGCLCGSWRRLEIFVSFVCWLIYCRGR